MQTYASVADASCLDELHATLERLWIEAPDVEESHRIRLAIALAELVGNVVEHGRTPRGGTPTLSVEVSVSPDRLQASVIDDGVPIGPRSSYGRPLDELAENGRGLTLAREALDELRYVPEETGNRWSLVLRRDGHA